MSRAWAWAWVWVWVCRLNGAAVGGDDGDSTVETAISGDVRVYIGVDKRNGRSGQNPACFSSCLVLVEWSGRCWSGLVCSVEDDLEASDLRYQRVTKPTRFVSGLVCIAAPHMAEQKLICLLKSNRLHYSSQIALT